MVKRIFLPLVTAVLLFSGNTVQCQSSFQLKNDKLKNNFSEFNIGLFSKIRSQRIIFSPGDSTELCNIFLTTNNVLKDVRITDSNDSLFTITKSNVNKTFEISAINRIEIIQHGFWNGFFYGGIASVGICGILGLTTWHGEAAGYGFIFGLILAAPTGLIVGLISEFVTKNAVYNFNGADQQVKSKRLKYVRDKHKY
jgi:hypothetical protein